MLSPKMLRNSLKAGVSSLFPNSSSSEVWVENASNMSFGVVWVVNSRVRKIAHLSKFLVDDSKLKRVVHLMLVISHYQLGCLCNEQSIFFLSSCYTSTYFCFLKPLGKHIFSSAPMCLQGSFIGSILHKGQYVTNCSGPQWMRCP